MKSGVMKCWLWRRHHDWWMLQLGQKLSLSGFWVQNESDSTFYLRAAKKAVKYVWFKTQCSYLTISESRAGVDKKNGAGEERMRQNPSIVFRKAKLLIERMLTFIWCDWRATGGISYNKISPNISQPVIHTFVLDILFINFILIGYVFRALTGL